MGFGAEKPGVQALGCLGDGDGALKLSGWTLCLVRLLDVLLRPRSLKLVGLGYLKVGGYEREHKWQSI